MTNSIQTLFLSHGGGPLPILGDDSHKEMVLCLKDIAERITKPSAIILISAHWEEELPTITYAEQPPLIYDYYGFPEESYSIQYPCKGETKLAEQVYHSLDASDIDARLESERGFDHGLFIPLKIMYPDANIPCVQLSLVNHLNAEMHIKIGQALKTLDYENLLVIGSGFSFHNMKAFFEEDNAESISNNEAFEAWLIETCSSKEITEQERSERLINWETAPAARYCHPREEHLLPLHVCYGLTSKACNEVFQLKILNKQSSMYLW